VLSYEATIARVKTTASQKCLLAYKPNCASFDKLSEAADKIIGQLVITCMTNFKGRVKIVMVGESLGF